MLRALRQYLKLTPADLATASPDNWQLSVFRIMVLSGLLLVLVICLHSSWQAWQIGAYHIIAITSVFYLALLWLLRRSKASLSFSAAGFLLLVVCAGLAILLFNPDFEMAKLGIVFLYALPTIALMFFPLKVMVGLMLLNFIPFAFLLYNQPLPRLFDFSITLPQTHAYLHGLIFLFFNLCLPLASARIIRTIQRHSTGLQQANKQLSQSHDFYAELFENNGEATLLCAGNGRIIKANTKACQWLGINADSHCYLSQVLVPEQDCSDNAFWLAQDLPCIARNQPGRHLQLKHMVRTRQHHHVLQLQDVTAMVELKQQLDQQHQHQHVWQLYDRLTCLPKADFFRQQADERLHDQPGWSLRFCVIIRLCHIKTLNQQYGYEFGSQVLQQFASQLRQSLRPDALLGRLRGVKFALLLPIQPEPLSPAQQAELIHQQLPDTLVIGAQQIQLRYQLGYCLSEGHADAATLLEQCEIALEQADNNLPMVQFAPEQAAELQQTYALANALQDAIRQRQLALHLQPKVNGEGQIKAFEALCRWQHQDKWIAPDLFVALAAQHGFMKALSQLVLDLAIDILAQWQERRWFYPIAINLAGPELLDDSFFAYLLAQSAHYPWLTKRLQLEITETHFATQQPALHTRLRALSQYGFSIAIDDFGTGHASLSQLVDMPADTLKIDRRFVAAIPHHRQQVKVLHTTLQLARALNLTTVAEGVENDIQRKFLAKLGFPLLQGYLFGRPAPAEHWHARLEQQQPLLPEVSRLSGVESDVAG